MEAIEFPYRACVGIVLFNAAGLVWMGRRIGGVDGSRYLTSRWQCPQGGIDAEETPRAAALRELHEETGIRSVLIIEEMAEWLSYDFPPEIRVDTMRGAYRGQRQKWFAMRFLGDDGEIDLNCGVKAEFDAWNWLPLSEATELVVGFKRRVYSRLIEAFADHARVGSHTDDDVSGTRET